MKDQVYALAVSGGNVYAGGRFSSAGYYTAYNVAKWHGSSSSALGSGTSGTSPSHDVLSLLVSGSYLYIGVDFTYAGGSVTNRTPANYIAKWDGNSWSALGSGMNMDVRTFAVSGNDLYAAGKFTTAGGKAAAYVARAYLPDLPSLSVLSSDTNVTVSWPSADTADFVLEQAEGPKASWVRNLASISDDGTHKSVTLPATLSAQYFRLRRP
jgi:hypothetical protein